MAEYSRPQGFRFAFNGVNLRSTPDAIPPGKYQSAQNVRSVSGNSVRTRPGYVPQFNTGPGLPITDLAAYATLGTDDFPRFLARDTSNNIVLDNGVVATTLSGAPGPGVSMLPFRPNASPQAWMYIAGYGDYQKISAPNGGSVIPQKVGIAEVTFAVEAGVVAPQWTNISGLAAGWTSTGTTGSLADSTVFTDTVGTAIYPDPVIATRYTVPTTDAAQYIIGMLLVFQKSTSGSFTLPVQDVLPAAIKVSGVTIQAIRYNTGTTGRCVIIPNQFPQQTINLRRGCLLTLNSGGGNAETVFVLNATFGAQESVVFECVTVNAHASGEPIVGVDAIIVDGVDATIIGQTVTSPDITSTITAAGTATFSQSFLSPTLPFSRLFTSGGSSLFAQPDDYIHLFCLIQNIAALTSITIVFSVGTTVSYTAATLSYTVQAAGLVSQNGSDVYEISFPISALTATGITNPDITQCNGVQIQAVTTAGFAFDFGMLWFGGGGNPDIGANGAEYQYEVKPRSSLTGATGNPSPQMRYGVSPRRQNVIIPMPSQYDSQIDSFDVYRYGGSITSYRYIGTGYPSSNFIDQYFDDTEAAGNAIVTDDYEPWPSIDSPLTIFNGNPAGTTIVVIGTEIVVTWPGPWPATILNWLPGTLIIIGGLQTFTLRQRPTMLSSTSYLFVVDENSGYVPTAFNFQINEPIVARQFAPAMWGPDANGFFYAVMEPLRPGCVYYSKPYSPDTTNQNVVELTPPSIPMVSGEIINGLSYAASTDQWWALYPTFGGTVGQFSPLQISVGRGVAAPFGICSDNQNIYFWAKDCIASMSGGPYKDLTSGDLYGLFPREGVEIGANMVRNGITYYAPDYSRAATFRLEIDLLYLWADYQDSTGTPRTLVMDRQTGGWSTDVYHDLVKVHFVPKQQTGTLREGTGTGTPMLFPILLMGDALGYVWRQQDFHNDNASPITAQVCTNEWDGGDQRAGMQWGDEYLDCLAPAGLTAQPVSQGEAIGGSTAIIPSPNRTFNPVSLGGETLLKFLGMLASWTDDFTSQTNPTTLYLWQPSLVPKPETILDRYGDWENGGGAKYYRGFVLEADTFGNAKGFGIRNEDDGTLKSFTINYNGQGDQPFYFTPFVGHLVRYEPATDGVPMRFFGIKWIFDPWPELTNLSSPWLNLGTPAAKYLRAAVIPMDTNGAAVTLKLISSDGGFVTLGPFTTTAQEKTQVPLAFSVPLIGHEFQIEPLGPVRIWYEEIKWEFEQYPELIRESTPWMNLGKQGAKYLRGVVLVIATEGGATTLTLLSSDGGSVSLGPFTTLYGIKTPVPWAFTIPLIGHEFQLQTSAPCRIWYEENRWDFDPWPELIDEATGWLPLMPGSAAAFLQGAIIPIETDGDLPQLRLLTDTGGYTNTIPLIATVTPLANVKTPVPYSLATPVVAHEVQLLPTSPCRIWVGEIQWISQPTPELATTWQTQPTDHGLHGWQHIGRIEAAYAATADVTLTITAEGISPAVITLPATGGTLKKFLVTPTVNKGQLYTYKAVSSQTFQIFAPEWTVWVGQWGRKGKYFPFKNLGGAYGDKAAI